MRLPVLAMAFLVLLAALPAAAGQFPAWATVYSLVKDGPVLWAGTGIGIQRINIETGESTQIVINEAFENKPRRIIRTQDEIWIARKFDVVQCAPDAATCRSQDIRQRGELILDAAHDGQNTWLLLSDRVMRYDPALHLWEEFHVFDKKKPNHDFRAMASSGNALWLGEVKGNICTLSKTDSEMDCPLPFSRIPFHKWGGAIVPTETHVWFFYANTLMAYNIKSNTVSAYRTPAKGGDSGMINSILADGNGAIWYSSHRNLGKFDPLKEQWSQVFSSSRGYNLLIAGRLQDNLIITTSKGLARFDPQRESIKYYTLPDVFNSSYQPLAAVLGDEIWMGFPSGKTMKFNPNTNQPAKTVLPPCPVADILEKNFEGLESSRVSLPLALEHLATTQLEKHGARIWGASRYSLAMNDRTDAVWNVRTFSADTKFFHLGDAFVLATPDGKLYLCAADDISCTPPRHTVATSEKTAHPPVAVMKHRDDLIIATREGRILRYDLRKSAWSTILDIPDRWQKLHPAHAVFAGKTVWIARDNHLFRYQYLFSRNKLEHLTAEKTLLGNETLRLCAPDDNHAVVISDTHAHLFTGANRVSTPLPCGRSGVLASPCIERDGNIWAAVSSMQSAPGCLVRVDYKRNTITTLQIPRQDIAVYDIEPDGNTVWLGTSAGILGMDISATPPVLRPLKNH